MLLKQRSPRTRDKGHLEALAQCPCAVCGANPPSECAHVRVSDFDLQVEQAGMGAKPDDEIALPMCPDHHRLGDGAEHVVGTKAFWRKHATIKPLALARELYRLSPNVEAMSALILRGVYFR